MNKGIRFKGFLDFYLRWPYYLFLLLASICSGGIQSAPEQLLMTFALCLGGGMLGGILS